MSSEKSENVEYGLEAFREVEGFKGAILLTAEGEVLESVTRGRQNLEVISVLANSVLRTSQKACLEMGTGRGRLIHIEAEDGHILARCFNQGTNPLATEEGKVHVHLVMVLGTNANLGMAKMRLASIGNSAVAALAAAWREQKGV